MNPLRQLILPLLIAGLAGTGCRGQQKEPEAHAKQQGGEIMSLDVTSSAFEEGGSIPARYTCDGDNISPPLAWSGLPDSTESLALVVEDPDAPSGTFFHWLLYNIPAVSTQLAEDVPKEPELANGSRQGKNGFKGVGYGGPCPPPNSTHHYHFKLYALDTALDLEGGVSKADLEAAMKGHILEKGELTATYRRQ